MPVASSWKSWKEVNLVSSERVDEAARLKGGLQDCFPC